MDMLADRVFETASARLKMMDRMLQDGRCPKCENEDGSLVTTDIWWWCSGFYPGSLWLTYEYTGDKELARLAARHTEILSPIQFRTDDHDVGFQLGCSYGNGYRLTGDTTYRAVICNGAHSLATRFNPAVGCTRSWNNDRWHFPVIIDNMMNLELLFLASELCGDSSLYDIAVRHAVTTMKNHYRDDASTFHLVDYDPETGKVLRRQTVQGFADWSSWSRGQAWGLYGYTMVYRYTGKKRFLSHAEKIADYIIGRLPDDGIPYWDFDSDSIPDDYRDASAGAIIASALVELGTLSDDEDRSTEYLATAEKILRRLASDEYLSEPGSDSGFILRHSVGNKPGNDEVDTPLTYADYYFLEAFIKYMKNQKLFLRMGVAPLNKGLSRSDWSLDRISVNRAHQGRTGASARFPSGKPRQ
ncbi:MAG: glycoside hydrolase family 88 protein [Bacteroidetes bacterium]|uniref:Glycoside hydrolase family 88 protein n=1 Tax=Candidatus Cryptobacteroides excrementipullorum TaxID=2840761 RepID=A0A9D9IUC8_9BACT|nr:glycoside hydrolase family 88 protein [Candidatus Cryptobacteroides excrementipullorum]